MGARIICTQRERESERERETERLKEGTDFDRAADVVVAIIILCELMGVVVACSPGARGIGGRMSLPFQFIVANKRIHV